MNSIQDTQSRHENQTRRSQAGQIDQKMAIKSDSILLVLPVAFKKGDNGELCLEKQACNGIDRWADNFARVTVACPVIDESRFQSDTTIEHVPASDLQHLDRVELVELPASHRIRDYIQSRKLLARLIDENRYLCFAIGGLLGDWASLAATQAIRLRRPYAVWTDRVEHQVVRNSYQDRHGLRRIYRFLRDRLLQSWLMAIAERHVISRAELGLFHGMDCFAAYGHWCREPHLVHNIHLKESDRISPQALQEKMRQIMAGRALRISYAGRVAAMKGPLDWIETMGQLESMGIDFSASWLGDGPLLEQARQQLKTRGLDDRVSFPGHQGEKDRLLQSFRQADLFVFCHQTPESPRCLIEAMLSGTPIVGYDSPYPEDLLQEFSTRLLTARNDTAALASTLQRLDSHRDELARAVEHCHRISEHYTDQAVFSHRSRLIKAHLPA